MSDAMSLETPDSPQPATPQPVPVETPAPEPAPVAAAPAPTEEVDLNEVDPKDDAKVQALIAELSRKRAEARELKTKVQEVEQLRQYVAANQPYIEVLRQNPGLLRQRDPEPVKETPKVEESADALEAAKLMDFYKPDGTPDAVRGARHLAMVRQQAEAIARQTVAPVQQTIAQQKSTLNFQRALQTKAPNGAAPNPQILQQLWQNSPVESTADETYAGLMVLMAAGYDSLHAKPSPVPAVVQNAAPPLVTEAAGGKITPRVSMSDLEREIAGKRGIADDQWGKLTKDYHPGRANTLE